MSDLTADDVQTVIDRAVRDTGIDPSEKLHEIDKDTFDSAISINEVSQDAEVDLTQTTGIDFSLKLVNSGEITFKSSELSIIESENTGVKHVLQELPGDSLRLMTIADESYSDAIEHDYVYQASLPDGHWLHKFSDDTVGILAHVNLYDSQLDETESARLLSENLPKDFAYSVDNVAEQPIDDFELPKGSVLVGVFAPPWAVDSAGKQLPTTLEVSGDNLVQRVDTTSALFPVIADPLPLVGVALVGLARVLAPHVVRAFVAQTIRVGARATISGGYKTFQAFKKAHGVKSGYQWHHIVEQSTIKKRGFDARWIHNKNNLVQIPTGVHQKCVSSWMGKKGIRKFGAATPRNQTLRQWVHTQSYEKQHRVGVALLKYCGVSI
ncbi:hypothetical protein ACTOVJ_01280 [Arcanobacterium canis]